MVQGMKSHELTVKSYTLIILSSKEIFLLQIDQSIRRRSSSVSKNFDARIYIVCVIHVVFTLRNIHTPVANDSRLCCFYSVVTGV